MSRSVRTVLGTIVALALAGSAVAVARNGEGFPHEEHESLFPTCVGCHVGLASDAPAGALLYPPTSRCENCHNGRDLERVDWTGPAPRRSNLDFAHDVHFAETMEHGDSVGCLTCHAASSQPVWMDVAEAEPEACIDCHAHEADVHLAAEARCETCHLPLARAALLTQEDVAALPLPASHENPDFLFEHDVTVEEAASRCATCHARESCERCHRQPAPPAAVAALERDSRVAALVAGRPAEYPLPASHLRVHWEVEHGVLAAAQPAECSTCHTRPDCTTCHIDGARDAIRALPPPRAAEEPSPIRPALDVTALQRQPHPDLYELPALQRIERPEGFHPPDFDRNHAAAAATGQPKCESCHARASFCSDCHAAAAAPGFHPLNFLARHGVDAYARDTDCSSCHSTEVFCQSCHDQVGLRAEGRLLDVAYHNAEPLWLIQHSQAARQGLESCATCHEQRDCLQCHSAVGGRRINPHGADFDAERMADRSPVMCLRCHIRIPEP